MALFCFLVLILPQSLRAQAPAATWSVHYPNLPLSQVLEDYQEWTGKHIVRDPRIENVNVTIETAGTLTKEQAIEFVEKSLLLAGYAFVPSGDNMVKIVAFAAGGSPVSERVEMVLLEDELPKTDKIVSYLLRLNYLKADEAAQAFAQIVPNHPYGKITAVPNARALVITENSNTIRAYLDLARQVDVPPGETRPKTIQLVRADAEEVAKELTELLGLKDANGSAALKSAASVAPQKPGNPQQAAAAAAAQVVRTATVGGNEGESAPPKIQAIARTNSLIIIARPLDIEYIESLVKEFDAVAGTRGFISRKFRYMDVIEFANVAKDALLRGSKEASAAKLENPTDNKTTTTNTPISNTVSIGQSNSGGSGGGLGSGGGSTLGGGLQESQVGKMQSIVIGKTLLIVEPTNSRIFASGPPEQLALLEQLATELDKRPQQIRISAIIGEFTLGDDFQFGLDWVRATENLTNGNAVSGTSNATGNSPVDFLSFGKITDFPAPQGLAVYGHLGKYLNGFLTTLENTKRFHVLQRPNVSTLNHKLATISTGQQLAIPGQSLTTANNGGGIIGNNGASVVSTTQYIPVELRLDIIPHIYANDEVRLEFSQQNYDVAGFTIISGNRVPNISTQSLKNNIIVPSGTAVLLGGLITERDTNNKNGLPLLSRIPVVKHLFTSTTKNKERRELLIFVKPEVLPGGEDLVQSQNDILKQTQSYPATRQFTDPTASQNIAVPRAVRVSDEEAPAMNHIDLSTRFVAPATRQ